MWVDWGGHWRGENATQETVICPVSFSKRLPLNAVCALGNTVAGSKLNAYWAVDLLHRFFHVPAISEGMVEHYAETLGEILEMASHNNSDLVFDSDALQYFALDAWANDVAAPGKGCWGVVPKEEAAPQPSTTASVLASTPNTKAPTPASTPVSASMASVCSPDDQSILIPSLLTILSRTVILTPTALSTVALTSSPVDSS